MTIFNVLAFGGHWPGQDAELPDTNTPSTWSGRTFVLVQGKRGDDFAVYWQWNVKGWTVEQTARSGHKIPASSMKGSELDFIMQQGLIQEMPDEWHYRA